MRSSIVSVAELHPHAVVHCVSVVDLHPHAVSSCVSVVDLHLHVVSSCVSVVDLLPHAVSSCVLTCPGMSSRVVFVMDLGSGVGAWSPRELFPRNMSGSSIALI